MQAIILTTAQAKAVYDAMCALNNVNMRLHSSVTTTDATFTAIEHQDGLVVLTRMGENPRDDVTETYGTQTAFAAAYGLA